LARRTRALPYQGSRGLCRIRVAALQRFIGRAVAAIAADPDRQRWNQLSVTSGLLAATYGSNGIDGSGRDAVTFTRAQRAMIANLGGSMCVLMPAVLLSALPVQAFA
jgi:hypothetical protein